MKLSRLAALLAGCALFASGCAFHRGNVAALSKEQDSYYAKLEETLTKGRPNLVDALAKQLRADRVRQGNLLEWERDLAKAEVLLQLNANTSGNRRLLLLKTTESDLKSLSQVHSNKSNTRDNGRLSTSMTVSSKRCRRSHSCPRRINGWRAGRTGRSAHCSASLARYVRKTEKKFRLSHGAAFGDTALANIVALVGEKRPADRKSGTHR